MSRWSLTLLVAILMVVGLVKSAIKLLKIDGKMRFTDDYSSKFRDYVASNFEDYETYAWLVHESVKMQICLGSLGIMDYKPAGANYYIRNYQIIVNMLSELRQAHDRFLSGITSEYVAMIQETLLRYRGVLCESHAYRKRLLYNPFHLLREGIEYILLVPLNLLACFGLVRSSYENIVSGHIVTRLIVGVVSLLTVLSAIVSLVAGWHPFVEVVSRWFNLASFTTSPHPLVYHSVQGSL